MALPETIIRNIMMEALEYIQIIILNNHIYTKKLVGRGESGDDNVVHRHLSKLQVHRKSGSCLLLK